MISQISSSGEARGKVNLSFIHPEIHAPIHNLATENLSYLFEWVAHLKSSRSEPASVTGDISGKFYVERKPRRCRCPWYKYYSDSDCVCGSEEPPPWFPVSLVCRHWYDIAASTPSLWTNIVVTSRSRPPFYRIAKQLEQSKDLPIDIQINLDSLKDLSSMVDSFCSLLLTKADHWRSLEVRAKSCQKMLEIHDAIFKTGTQINATRLRSILLSGGGEWERYLSTHGLSNPFALFGRSAPHLNTISLSGIGANWNQDWICSASHLTTLEISSDMFPSWAEFAAILRGAPHLQVLALRNYRIHRVESTWVDPRSARAIPVELLELKQLDINLPVAAVIQFLRRCYIPSLTKLMLRLFPDNEQELQATVEQLVSPLPHARTSDSTTPPGTPRSLLAGLEHLYLDSVNFSAEHTNLMYRHMDQLTSLSLGMTGWAAFVDPLFPHTGRTNDVRLPRLKSLAVNLSYSSLRDWEARRLFALAWHRKDLGLPLRSLCIRGLYGEVSKECLAWCEENLEAFCFK